MKTIASQSKRKRGAQPGNVNAVRYPWRVFFNRGVLKDEYAHLKPWMDAYKRGLLDDKSGEDNMSSAEIFIANVAERAFGTQLMIFAEASRQGLTRQVKDGWDLQPGFKEVAKFMEIELKSLKTYGTKRRPKDLPSLDQYIRDKYGNRDGQIEPGLTQGAGDDQEVQPQADSATTEERANGR